MKTLAVILGFAILAVAGSVYTDAIFTGAQSAPSASDLPMMQGQSHAPLGFR